MTEKRRLVALCLGGVVLECGCLWLLVWSPSLTALYTPEFTREFLSRIPLPVVHQELQPPMMLALLQIGLATMALGYILGLYANAATHIITAFALLFRLTLLCLPGLFSTDIFSYVMAGRIAAVHAANPYVSTPADFPEDAFLSWVFPFWRDATSVYGPLWTSMSWALSTLSGQWSNFDQVLLYRTVLFAFDLLALYVVWRLLHLAGHTQPASWCLFAWNPLWLFDIVGNAHNDVVMVSLMLCGVYCAWRRWPRTGIAVLTMSALVKFTSALGLLFFIVSWALAPPRVTRIAQAAAIVLGLTLVTSLAWPGALVPSVDTRVVINSPSDLAARTVADVLNLPMAVARTWIHDFALAVFAVYIGWELWRVVRKPGCDVVPATARALLLLPLLLANAAWSWYFSWSFAMAALLGWRSWLARLVLLYTLFVPPAVYAQQYLNIAAPEALVIVSAVGPLLVWAAWRAAHALASLRPEPSPR